MKTGKKKQIRANQSSAIDIQFAMDLPIHAHLGEICQTLQQCQVVVISGATGSGKTTQIPKLCLLMGRGKEGIIGHTQPRRIAAKTVAMRIADELGVIPGQLVGFQVRHTDHTSDATRIKVMTDGILLAELQHDRKLARYDTLIIDEAHERSLNIDFILGYLQQLLPQRPDLKLIITSATIDTEKFSSHFHDAPIIEVSGHGYPVEVRYRPPDATADDETEKKDAQEDETFMSVIAAIRELSRSSHGDILIFLEGEREIHELSRFLKRQKIPDTDILPLFSRLNSAGQTLIFKPHKRRHIVLATNVAETSLTIPGIHFVIDTGYARISRYNRRSKIQQLHVEKISQAAAEQRKGRCGRVAAGICIRLYSADDFETRAPFTEPEILRTSLASVILQMKSLQLGDIHDFPLMDPPDTRYINDGLRLLHELGALDSNEELTGIGSRLARLPLDPSLARVLLAASDYSCLREMLVIVSVLSMQDPRERPLDFQEQADEAHARFHDERSDFVTLLKIWEFYDQHNQTLSSGQIRKICRQNFFSYTRMREWHEVHEQLTELSGDLGLHVNKKPASYDKIHMALITGLLSHIAVKTEDREYIGARGIKLNIFPGSGQFRKSPKWIVCAELVETSKLYARTVAGIDAQWILRPASHLLQREYFEPIWDSNAGYVFAFERIKLFGLTIVEKQKISYGKINPVEARQIFIRRALVEHAYQTRGKFFDCNRELITAVMTLEHKARRHDIYSENALYEFYNKIIPLNICNGPAFEKWIANDVNADECLRLPSMEEIMYHTAQEITRVRFPDTMSVAKKQLTLNYCFMPGAVNDGLTMQVPLPMLKQIDPVQLEYLVPGMLEEKIFLMLKSLPKQVRRNLAPLQSTARDCLGKITTSRPGLASSLSNYLAQSRGLKIEDSVWATINLPEYLLMNIQVLDDARCIIAQGRDLRKLQHELSGKIQDCFGTIDAGAFLQTGIKQWSFGDLPESLTVNVNATALPGYPALVDKQNSVDLQIYSTRKEAAAVMQSGLKRLFMLELRKEFSHLKKNLPHLKDMSLYYTIIGTQEELQQCLLELITERVFLYDRADLRRRDDFIQRKQTGLKVLFQEAGKICNLTCGILHRFYTLNRQIEDIPAGHVATIKDIREHLDYLVHRKFLLLTDMQVLEHYPRYLDAISKRIEKLAYAPHNDEKLLSKIRIFYDANRNLPEPGEVTDSLRHSIIEFRRMLEEYRVSLFAQELGTIVKVSDIRLQNQLKIVRTALAQV